MDIEKNELIYMLGKDIEVTNIINENDILIGEIDFNGEKIKTYIISEGKVENKFYGKIVGIIKIKHNDEFKAVVSEKSSNIYYSEIKGILQNKIKELYNAKFKCLHEKSAGIVVYKIINKEPYFLIIWSKKKIPGFPKGHIEYGEKEEDAAIRETMEETGLKLDIENDFKEKISYFVDNTPIQKEVVFFLGKKIENQTINIDVDEISDFKFLNFNEAKSILPKDLIGVLTSAKNYIDKIRLEKEED